MNAARMNAAAPPALRVGIVGYGMMGKAHSYGYRVAPLLRRLPVTPVVTVMSGRDSGAVRPAALLFRRARHHGGRPGRGAAAV
jgi:hypothetical protein